MPPDPRADDIVRWRYAIVANSLRASAQGIDDARKARTLLMWADHYERLAVMPELGHELINAASAVHASGVSSEADMALRLPTVAC